MSPIVGFFDHCIGVIQFNADMIHSGIVKSQIRNIGFYEASWVLLKDERINFVFLSPEADVLDTWSVSLNLAEECVRELPIKISFLNVHRLAGERISIESINRKIKRICGITELRVIRIETLYISLYKYTDLLINSSRHVLKVISHRVKLSVPIFIFDSSNQILLILLFLRREFLLLRVVFLIHSFEDSLPSSFEDVVLYVFVGFKIFWGN